MIDTDRPRGVLTKDDREYLLGEKENIEPQSQTERNVRGRIRERVKQAVFDMPLLLKELEHRDRKRAIGPQRAEGIGGAIASMTGLVYLFALDEHDASDDMSEGDFDKADAEFVEYVEEGIRQAYSRLGISLNGVDVTVSIDRGEDLDEVMDRLERGEELDEVSDEQLHQLFERGELTPTGLLRGRIALRDSDGDGETDEE